MPRFELETDPIDFQRLHEAVFPADVREGEGLKARFKLANSDNGKYEEARIWRISPVGVELVVQKNHEFSKGELIDLILVVGGQRSNFQGSVVECSAEFDENNVRMGIRLSPIEDKRDGRERRQESRWTCSGQYHPTAVAQNPAKFNDYLYFKISDISVSGMQLVSSLRNKFLLPGMTLELQMSLPMVGQISLTVTIARVGFALNNGKDYLVIGATFTNVSQAAKNAIGQYLLQFATDVDLELLRQHSFYPNSVANAISFSFLRTEEEYAEVLELRHKAYKHANKVPDTSTPSDMADMFDTRSRIIIARHHGRVVASTRMTFAEMDQKFELENEVGWLNEFPRREEAVELSKLCTDPDYRGGDLLLAVIRQVALTSLQSGRTWVILGSTRSMKGLYEQIGLKQTSAVYNHEQYNNIEHVIMQGFVPSFLKGEGVGVIHWNVVWKGLSDYLSENQAIQMDGLSIARLTIYRLCAPLAWLANSRTRKPKKLRKKN